MNIYVSRKYTNMDNFIVVSVIPFSRRCPNFSKNSKNADSRNLVFCAQMTSRQSDYIKNTLIRLSLTKRLNILTQIFDDGPFGETYILQEYNVPSQQGHALFFTPMDFLSPRNLDAHTSLAIFRLSFFGLCIEIYIFLTLN